MTEHPDTQLQRVIDVALLAEVEANCRIFLQAWNELRFDATRVPIKTVADDSEQVPLRRLMYEFWGRVYSLIEAANRITRILWEVDGCQAFRERNRLSVPPVLAKTGAVRAIRNALEHTETRIPDFVRFRVAEDENSVVKGWGLSNAAEGFGDELSDSFRSLNIYTFRCVVQDADGEHECDLRELAKAVQDLNLALPEHIGGFRSRVD